MTKMAATPIYGENPLKIFSGTKWPMTLGLGGQHWGLRPNKICSNDDLGLTFCLFYGKVRFASLCFYNLKIYIPSGKMLERHLMEETYNRCPE